MWAESWCSLVQMLFFFLNLYLRAHATDNTNALHSTQPPLFPLSSVLCTVPRLLSRSGGCRLAPIATACSSCSCLHPCRPSSCWPDVPGLPWTTYTSAEGRRRPRSLAPRRRRPWTLRGTTMGTMYVCIGAFRCCTLIALKCEVGRVPHASGVDTLYPTCLVRPFEGFF
jgi:hypothetical protein